MWKILAGAAAIMIVATAVMDSWWPGQQQGGGRGAAPAEVEAPVIKDGKIDIDAAKNEPAQLDIQKGAIVHLFEWKWDDIADECEKFLGPKGIQAIQISPPTENVIIEGRPWWERYQPVSYKLESRSGTRKQLQSMLKRCNDKGVRVFADVVFNHMTTDTAHCQGTAGSICDPEKREYPAVPYTWDDFHQPRCDIGNMQNATEVRVCEMFHLHDLNQTRENVQEKIVGLMNDLIDIGVAGFRINAAKNMYAGELYRIYSKLNDLNVKFGLPKRTKPMIFQDIHDMGGEAVKYEEYVPLALITDVRYGDKISKFFKHKSQPLSELQHLNKDTFLTPDSLSLVFVDNHNTEREGKLLNYKQQRAYKMAVSFMLAYGYGYPFVLSGFKFEGYNDAPPTDDGKEISSPNPNQETNLCNDKWVCQHRWRQIYTMIQFNRATFGTSVTSWWDNGKSQIAFSRGNKGFVAFNLEDQPLDATIKTELPVGKYCDVISGVHANGKCGGKEVEVVKNGDHQEVKVLIQPYNENDHFSDGVFAIFHHEISKKSS